jgi:predicted transcriptional regulator
MAKALISVRVDEDLLRQIDEIAEKEGVTRTEIIETALLNGVNNERQFVENLEKPLQRMVMKFMTSRPLVDLISGVVSKQPSKRRVNLAHKGLRNQRTAELKLKKAKE